MGLATRARTGGLSNIIFGPVSSSRHSVYYNSVQPGVIAANWQLARLSSFDMLTKLAAEINELKSPVHNQSLPSRYRRNADANVRMLDFGVFDSNDSSFRQLSFAIRALLQLCATCRLTNSRVMLSLRLPPLVIDVRLRIPSRHPDMIPTWGRLTLVAIFVRIRKQTDF